MASNSIIFFDQNLFRKSCFLFFSNENTHCRNVIIDFTWRDSNLYSYVFVFSNNVDRYFFAVFLLIYYSDKKYNQNSSNRFSYIYIYMTQVVYLLFWPNDIVFNWIFVYLFSGKRLRELFRTYIIYITDAMNYKSTDLSFRFTREITRFIEL